VATVRIEEPRLASLLFGIVSRYPTMTEEEIAGLEADERDIPERPPIRGRGGHAGGGAAGAGGAG
jgi:hypothetical protein